MSFGFVVRLFKRTVPRGAFLEGTSFLFWRCLFLGCAHFGCLGLLASVVLVLLVVVRFIFY